MTLRLTFALLLSLLLPIASRADDETRRMLTVRPGDTLGGLLAGAGIEAAADAIAAIEPLFPSRSLAPGQELAIRLGTDLTLLALEIEAAPGRVIALHRQAGAWRAEQHITPRLRRLLRIEAAIGGDGVFATLTRHGLPAAMAQALIQALAHAVDFQRDLRPGDRIDVAFEQLRATDDLLGHGALLQAAITLSGRRLEVWRHEDGDWYRADGGPLAGGFLRTPLDGARITSGFGARRHPVLGFRRGHEGLDFGAPTGTPVHAASDGTVASARFESGYGRTVRLRHADGVETVYAHLSRFAPGLDAGDQVRQGRVIGAVGSSGLSTGPHLHYEIRIAGRAQDPSRVALPGNEALRGPALAAFQDRRRALGEALALIAGSQTEVALARD